jgi:hypothetical protein
MGIVDLIKKAKQGSGTVVQAYNPSSLGEQKLGGSWFEASEAKSLSAYLKNPKSKKGIMAWLM